MSVSAERRWLGESALAQPSVSIPAPCSPPRYTGPLAQSDEHEWDTFRLVFSVETRTVAGQVTAVGSAGPFTVVIDRPADAGGGGKGFNGGQLLYLAIAGCVSNDLFREAPRFGVNLHSVRVTVSGDFAGDPVVSQPVTYDVELSGDGDLERLVEEVDRIAEIPNSLRQATPVSLGQIQIA